MDSHLDQLLSLLWNVTIKSLVIATLAGMLLFLFRLRDSNTRHAVWLSVSGGNAVAAGTLVVVALAELVAKQIENALRRRCRR